LVAQGSTQEIIDNMNRYLVFYGMWYYPLGGMSDFKGSFHTLEESINFINENKDWYDIFDSEMKYMKIFMN
jgi:hypothetical protein